MEDGETVPVSVERQELVKEKDLGTGSDEGSELSDGESAEDKNTKCSSDVRLNQSCIKPVDSGIEIKSLGLQHSDEGSQSLDVDPGLTECSDSLGLKGSNSSNHCANSEVFFNVGDDNAVDSTSLLSQDSQENSSALDHPLRSLSCIKIDEQNGSSFNFDIPEVKISNPRKAGSRSDCIPLRNLFQSEEGNSDRNWAESIGYKNWLLHLARRRRCEILVLIGFLMWLIFFIALAIALNGNGKLLDEENGNSNLGDGYVNNSSNGKLKDGNMVGSSLSTVQETSHQTIKVSTTQASHEHTEPHEPAKFQGSMTTGTPFLHETRKGFMSTLPPFVDTTQSQLGTTDEAAPDVPTIQANFKLASPTEVPLGIITHLSDDTVNVPVRTTVEASPAVGSVTAISNVDADSGPSTSKDKTTSHFVTPPTHTNRASNTLLVSNHKMLNDSHITDAVLFANNGHENPTPTTQSVESDTQVLSLLSELSKMTDDANTPNYLIGVGRADITGPAADVNMMGYANPKQVSGGIHLRQYSRAFIVQDPDTRIRTVFVNIDACMASTLIKLEVMKIIKKEFGDLYRPENLCISGTHTHSGPAGFLQDVLFQITSWGYVEETLTAMVTGIVKSIRSAHNSIQPGYILFNKGELVGSNINRSPTAYENNPAEERARYEYNVDTEMVMLKFIDQNNKGIGMINWFPVHCTSMNNTNNLISSDNKGYAEILFETFMDPNSRPGESNFVAAFAQSNEGDVSPNTRGPHCTDTGAPCDNVHSTCDGRSQYCVASGPGKDMFESTNIIGQNQFEKARELYLSAKIKLSGSVKFIHEYVNMTNYEVILQNKTKVKTCKPAMGYSFAAGTTDGPGAFDFKQGDKSGNKFWNLITNFLHAPSEEQTNCHHPKPILLDTGEMESPYEWQPQIVETQILQIGQFLIAALPGEFSTMSGRRLRDGIIETFKSHDPNTKYEVTLAGLANSYSDYITTHEEYLVQRYEGASTIYGPYTSEAHTQQFRRLSRFLALNENITSEVEPVDIKDKLMSFQIGVIYDGRPFFKSFGDVSSDVKNSYIAGEEVTVTFIAGNPRNCLKVDVENMSFLTVEKEMIDGSWKIIFTDADWDTKFTWVRTSTIRGLSDAIISWQTHKNTPPGKYRIRHHGYSKSLISGISPYSGTSSAFLIKSS